MSCGSILVPCRTKIANKIEDVWPFKKRQNRTAFSGKKPHRDIKIPLHNGILSEAFKGRKSVEVQRPDSRLVLEYESLAINEVCACLSVMLAYYISVHKDQHICQTYEPCHCRNLTQKLTTRSTHPQLCTQVQNMLVVPIYRNTTDSVVGVFILINKRESFVLEDSRKLEHYRSSVFATVDCISRYECKLACEVLRACCLPVRLDVPSSDRIFTHIVVPRCQGFELQDFLHTMNFKS